MNITAMEGKPVPSATFKTRVPDATSKTGQYTWKDVTSAELFAGKKIVLFALPGAFTPTCSSFQVPGYEAQYDDLKKAGADDVYCLSVNDAFVMNSWKKEEKAGHLTFIPDGSGEFTRAMGMLVKKNNLGFGERSWRYSMYVVDGIIQKMFVEPGFQDDCPTDPFEISDAQTMLAYLKGLNA